LLAFSPVFSIDDADYEVVVPYDFGIQPFKTRSHQGFDLGLLRNDQVAACAIPAYLVQQE
jgi:hypothetical protein